MLISFALHDGQFLCDKTWDTSVLDQEGFVNPGPIGRTITLIGYT